MTLIRLLESASFSYPSSTNKENQDSILSPIEFKEGICMAVADGVGGSPGGAIASSTAISAIKDKIFHTPETTIDELFNVAQRSVSDSAMTNNLKRMATTLLICKATAHGFEIGSTGDSRAYLIRNGEITTLTKDQTEKQELIDKKVFTEEELINHRSGKILTSTINAENNFDLIHYSNPATNGIVILMTDGAYESIDINRIAKPDSSDLISICSKIKQAIISSNPTDDFSLVAMKF